MTIGTDPEFIVTKEGKPVPFLDYLESYYKVDGFVTLLRDNVLLELNTIPAKSREEFIEIQHESIKCADNFINKEFGLRISRVPFKRFSCKDFRFFEAGCSPSYNIYNGKQEFYALITGSTRYCGGHVHIGYGETEDFSLRLIQNLDYHIGLNLNETPSKRRKYYGRAGEYRRINGVKVEYRTPGNEWLWDKAGWIYDQICRSMEDTSKGVLHKVDPNLINKPKVLC